MSVRRAWLALAAASVAFAVSGSCGAFCLTHSCKPEKQHCEFVNSCNVSGKVLFWASSTITWSVQVDGSLAQKISADVLDTFVSDAAERWESVDCGGGLHPSITLSSHGQVSCNKAEYNKTQPNQNLIVFRDDKWPYKEDAETDTIALTTVTFNTETGEIYDADLELNSFERSFALVDAQPPRTYDLASVLTHELGHFLGLSHNELDPSTTMSVGYHDGMTSLEADDIAGVCAALPPGRVSKDTTDPRHGFSTECGKPESGCCSSIIGGQAPPSEGLALFGFGLGAAVWSSRTRVWRRHARTRRAARVTRSGTALRR